MSLPDDLRLDRLAELVRALQVPESDAATKDELLRRHEAEPPNEPSGVAAAVPINGKRIHDFVLVRELGRGGMGIIYEALDPALARTVALKVLPTQFTLRPAMVERFRREATAVARLRHEGIIAIHRIEEAEGVHFFTMDLVVGASLDKVLTHLRHSERSAKAFHEALGVERPASDLRFIDLVTDCIARVGDALAHAHQHGVIHRDIKPSNILMRRDGTPVLTDFGLARLDDETDLTLAGEHLGTPSYMSPQQADPQRGGIDARTDVFSLGATLYELLTLTKPFDGNTTRQVIDKILHAEPRDPRTLQADIPEDLAAIVGKALEKQPDQRYASARAMVADLRAFLAHMPVSARNAGLAKRLVRYARREPLRAGLALTLALGIPALAWVGGTLIAKKDAIVVGELEIDIQRRESLLVKALMIQRADLSASLPIMGLVDKVAVAKEVDTELVKHPEDVEFLAAKGWILLRSKGPKSALAWLDTLGASANARELSWLRIALLLGDTNSAAGNADAANALETQLGAPRTPFEGFLHFLGMISKVPVTAERMQEALVVLMRASLEATRPRKVYYYYLAMVGIITGRAERTLLFAEAATKHWDREPMAWLLAAWSHQSIKSERARHFFQRAHEVDPEALSPLIELANAAFDAGEFEAAEPLLRKVIALDAANEDARSRLCKLALRQRDIESLRQELGEWERGAGTNWISWNALAMFRLQQHLPQSLRSEDAIDRALAKAMQLAKGKSFDVLWNYGSWKEQRGELALALPALERALSMPNVYSAQPAQLASRERLVASVRERLAVAESRPGSERHR